MYPSMQWAGGCASQGVSASGSRGVHPLGRHLRQTTPGYTTPGQTPPGKHPLPTACWDTPPSAVADLGGHEGRAPPHPRVQILSISCSFWKFWLNHLLVPPKGLAPPPQGNPGSVTILECILVKLKSLCTADYIVYQLYFICPSYP